MRSTRSRPQRGDDGWWVRAPETAVGCSRRCRLRIRGGSVVKVAVIGAGSWGTTVAAIAAANADDRAVGARPGVVERVNDEHRNPDYLPDIELPADADAPRPRSRRRAPAPTSW